MNLRFYDFHRKYTIILEVVANFQLILHHNVSLLYEHTERNLLNF